MKFTRDQVIEALMSEPLTFGAWVRPNLKSGSSSGCAVCAVGAVLRSAGLSDEEIHSDALGYTDGLAAFGNWENEIKVGNYLGALTCFFESMHDRNMRPPAIEHTTDDQRMCAVEWVGERFPAVFEADAGAGFSVFIEEAEEMGGAA